MVTPLLRTAVSKKRYHLYLYVCVWKNPTFKKIGIKEENIKENRNQCDSATEETFENQMTQRSSNKSINEKMCIRDSGRERR